jgi:hypothetical protein
MVIIVVHPPDGILTQSQRVLLRKIHGHHTVNICKQEFADYKEFFDYFIEMKCIFYLDSRNETWIKKIRESGYQVGALVPVITTYPGGIKTERFKALFYHKNNQLQKESVSRVFKRSDFFQKNNKRN